MGGPACSNVAASKPTARAIGRKQPGYHRYLLDALPAGLAWLGQSIVLERQQGADAGGYSGLEDEVDDHWAELFKAALLSTILGVGAELGAGADNGSNTDILQALRLGAANSLNQAGQQVTRRNLNIQPTLTIRPGFPVRVIVNRDLTLEPYRG
jgi:type IV secretion system protein TrbI